MNLTDKIKDLCSKEGATFEQKDGVITITPKPKGRWKPKEGEYYHTLIIPQSKNGIIWENDGTDKRWHGLGLCFKTQKEVDQYRNNRIKKIAILDRIAELNDARKNYGERFYIVYADGCFNAVNLNILLPAPFLYNANDLNTLNYEFGEDLNVLFDLYL